MALDREKLSQEVHELDELEHKLWQVKQNISHVLFTNPEEAVGEGLLKIDWRALRHRKYLDR